MAVIAFYVIVGAVALGAKGQFYDVADIAIFSSVLLGWSALALRWLRSGISRRQA